MILSRHFIAYSTPFLVTLHLYVPVNILKTYVTEIRPRYNPVVVDHLSRFLLVLITFLLAQIPSYHHQLGLSLYTSLVGFAWPALALIAPALIDTVIEIEKVERRK